MRKSSKQPKQGVAIVIAVGSPMTGTPSAAGEVKTSGTKIRGCGAATKGTTARGPMA